MTFGFLNVPGGGEPYLENFPKFYHFFGGFPSVTMVAEKALSEACKWQHWLARLLGRGRMCAGMKGNVPMARYLDTGDTFH